MPPGGQTPTFESSAGTMDLLARVLAGEFRDQPKHIFEDLRALANDRFMEETERTARAEEVLNGWPLAAQRQAERTRLRVAPLNGHTPPPAATLSELTLTSPQVKAMPPPEWLVEGVLVRNTIAWLVGRWGLGKSFYAVDLALSVATGTPFHGSTVKQCPVVYVVAEGAAGIGTRINAWEQHNDVIDQDQVHWLPRAVNLLDVKASGDLRALTSDVGAGLLIIDTLNRSMVGGDENSAKDASIVVEQLSLIAAAGTTVFVLHHPGKDVSRGGRGSSAFIGAMDAELEMDGEDHDITVTVTKQKDAVDGQQWAFRRTAVDGGSCVLVDYIEGADDLPTAALGALDALREIYVPGGVGVTTWLASSGTPTSSFYRYRALLVERELVRNLGTKHQARYQPIRADGGWPDD